MNADCADPATVEVVRNYLTSAATEMQRTLVRTAYHTIVYEIFDFGISIYDARPPADSRLTRVICLSGRQRCRA